MGPLDVHTRAEGGRLTPTEAPGIQMCLTFPVDFGYNLYPNVATVKEKNEAGEAKCVEEGPFQPARAGASGTSHSPSCFYFLSITGHLECEGYSELEEQEI